MIFPVALEDKFVKESIKFFAIFGCICFAIYIPTLISMYYSHVHPLRVLLRACNVITWVIPPSLPIFFSLNQTLALIRLSKKEVIGLFPDKLVAAGDCELACFDKTGTLT